GLVRHLPDDELKRHPVLAEPAVRQLRPRGAHRCAAGAARAGISPGAVDARERGAGRIPRPDGELVSRPALCAGDGDVAPGRVAWGDRALAAVDRAPLAH